MRETDFFDTNVLLYLFSADSQKADRAEVLLAAEGVISVQVLNEFSSVARRKLAMSWAEIQAVLADIRRFCQVVPLTLEIHVHGLVLAQRYNFSLYDAMVVASALGAGCETLWSEDFQDGLRIGDALTIRNPFKI